MRIYISVDMEGLAGVAHPHQVVFGPGGPDRTDYDRSRGLMAGETNAAIDAAFENGAREVVVNDSHWQMRNLRAEDLRDGARLIIGDKPLSMTRGSARPVMSLSMLPRSSAITPELAMRLVSSRIPIPRPACSRSAPTG